MNDITILRTTGHVGVYLRDEEFAEPLTIGEGLTDQEAVNNAIHNLEEAIQQLRDML